MGHLVLMWKCWREAFPTTLKQNGESVDKAQRDRLKAYEKKYKRPNHAVESAFLSREILKNSLFPLLRDYFNADSEQIRCILHAVMMAAGRHHPAWAVGMLC